MSDESTRQSDNLTPPTGSATVGVGISCFSTSTTASSIDLGNAGGTAQTNIDLYDRYITIQADGGDLYFNLSDAARTVDQTVAHASSISSATTVAVPWLLKDGTEKHFRLTIGSHRYLNVKAVSGTPYIRVTVSSQPKVR